LPCVGSVLAGPRIAGERLMSRRSRQARSIKQNFEPGHAKLRRTAIGFEGRAALQFRLGSKARPQLSQKAGTLLSLWVEKGPASPSALRTKVELSSAPGGLRSPPEFADPEVLLTTRGLDEENFRTTAPLLVVVNRVLTSPYLWWLVASGRSPPRPREMLAFDLWP